MSSGNFWIRRWPLMWPGREVFSRPTSGMMQWSWNRKIYYFCQRCDWNRQTLWTKISDPNTETELTLEIEEAVSRNNVLYDKNFKGSCGFGSSDLMNWKTSWISKVVWYLGIGGRSLKTAFIAAFTVEWQPADNPLNPTWCLEIADLAVLIKL